MAFSTVFDADVSSYVSSNTCFRVCTCISAHICMRSYIFFGDFTPVLDFPPVLELTSVIGVTVTTSSGATVACGEVGYMLLVYGTSILWMFSLQLVLLMNSLHWDALVGLFHFQPQSMKLSLLGTSLITTCNFGADNTMTVK